MSLETLEHALARLYTDDAFRERFYTRPEVGAEIGLDGDEISRLLAVDRARVEAFAASLRRKRLGKVRGIVRLLAETAGDEIERLFLDFARGFVPEGVHKHAADAIAFAKWVAARDDLSKEIRDAARFEAARLGLFHRFDGRSARPRLGPAVALTRRDGRRLLLLRNRSSSRYHALSLAR